MTRRHRTDVRGVYYVDNRDGTRSYIATWKERRPPRITDPRITRHRRVTKEAATFEEACRLRAEGEANQQEKEPAKRPSERLGERLMAGKWFEYWVRR